MGRGESRDVLQPGGQGSPEGREIVLRSLVALATVGAVALVPLGSAGATSTTAKRIAYVSSGHLWTIGANGTGTTDLGVSAHNPSFSSNGQQILFDDGSNVWSITAAGTDLHPVCATAGTDPSISPNGQKFAYVSSGGHVMVNNLNCAAGSAIDFGPGSSPAWAPDSSQIVFIKGAGGVADVAVGPATDGSSGSSATLSATSATESDPSWSPDGSRIVFVSAFPPAAGELIVMNADGTNRQQITNNTDAESSPSWAPGGDEILYEVGGQLQTITPNGSSNRLLAGATGASDPDWGLAVANVVTPTITVPLGAPFADGTALSADPKDWTSISAITYSYQWKRCSPDGTGCTSIAGANTGTYELTSADIGNTIRVAVTGTTVDGFAVATSGQTQVISGTAPQNREPPTINGDEVVGETLTASPGTWRGSNPVFTYQWQKCDSHGTPASCTNIAGATANVYVPVTGDVGSTLRVLVTATNSLGSATTPSGATPIVASTIPTNTSLPAIQAFLSTDGTVTSYSATTGAWTGSPTITYGYQWRRCDSGGGNCVDIPAAITSTYFPAAADIGSRLRVAVTATNDFGSATAVSDATNVLVGQAPANTFRPSVSGTAETGSTLFALNGTWTGSTPLTFTYEWRRCNASGGSCAAIPGETSSSYVVQSADVGATIVVAVTAKNASGSVTAVSSPTGVVQAGDGGSSPVRPQVRTLPSITGALVKGRLLRANPGSWSGTTPINYSYEWQRCPATSTACTRIPSATRETYTLVTADVGKRIRLLVAADNAAGSAEAQSPISQKVTATAPVGKKIVGKAKSERLNGGAGPDTIHGNGGNDRISGGAGADKLYGDAGNDTITGGAGRDAMFGGSGNDTIQAKDGERDTIDCGSGRDSVVADTNDVVKGCETVRR
jgi:hypothetical protein